MKDQPLSVQPDPAILNPAAGFAGEREPIPAEEYDQESAVGEAETVAAALERRIAGFVRKYPGPALVSAVAAGYVLGRVARAKDAGRRAAAGVDSKFPSDPEE